MNEQRIQSADPKNAWVIWGLILINTAVFFLMHHISSQSGSPYLMLRWGAMLTPVISEGGQYWRIFTAMFLHFDFQHLAGNMLTLFVIGIILENGLGHIRTALIYLLSGAGANLISHLWNVTHGETVLSAGASGAVFGLMGALIFASLFARDRVGALSVRQIVILLILSLYHGVETAVDDAAHFSGIVLGFLLCGITLLFRKQKERPPL